MTEAFVPSAGQARSDRQWWEDLGWIRPWSDNEEGRGGPPVSGREFEMVFGNGGKLERM